MLSDMAVRQAKPRDRDYKLADAEGLYLFVTKTGHRSWRFKYRFAGKERRLIFGGYPELSLKEARDRKADARKLLGEGMDGDKRILVFSDAGGTGRSYHADLAARNQARRVHFLLEPGWRADAAIQGLGRTNRTNQAAACRRRHLQRFGHRCSA